MGKTARKHKRHLTGKKRKRGVTAGAQTLQARIHAAQTGGPSEPSADGGAQKRHKTTSGAVMKPSISGTISYQSNAPFPRGGASLLTPLEKMAINKQAKRDLLFELKNPTAAKRKPRHRAAPAPAPTQGAGSDSDDDSLGEAGEGNWQTKVAPLTTARLTSPHLSSLGVIQEVTPFKLSVALPNNIIGSVAIADVSDALTGYLETMASAQGGDESDSDDDESDGAQWVDLSSLFAVGDYVHCAALPAAAPTGNQRLRLEYTLNPRVVNSNVGAGDVVAGHALWGQVTSVEDHGYIVDFGIDGLSGFLNHRAAPSDAYRVGQVAFFTVDDFTSAGVATLTVGREALSTIIGMDVSDLPSLTVDSVVPGMLVEAQVVRVVPESGLVVRFMDFCKGTIDVAHIDGEGDGDWASRVSAGDTITARVIWVDAPQRAIGLSTLSHLVLWNNVALLARAAVVGRVVDATVARVLGKRGVLIRFALEGEGDDDDEDSDEDDSDEDSEDDSEDDSHKKRASMVKGFAHAFVHVSLLSHRRVKRIEKRYGRGTQHQARLIGLSLMDGVVKAATARHVLEYPFVDYEDATVGVPVSGVVRSVSRSGITIRLSNTVHRVTATCSVRHLADVPVRDPSKFASVGDIVEGVVFRVDSDARRMLVTMKPSLVSAVTSAASKTTRTLLSLDDARAMVDGKRVYGVVQTMHRTLGVFVEFFDGLQGLVPMKEIRAGDNFQKGQLIRVHVKRVRRDGRIRLTLGRPDPAAKQKKRDLAAQAKHDRKRFAELSVGDHVPAIITFTNDKSIHLALEDCGLDGFVPLRWLAGATTAGGQRAIQQRAKQGVRTTVVVARKLEDEQRLVFALAGKVTELGELGDGDDEEADALLAAAEAQSQGQRPAPRKKRLRRSNVASIDDLDPGESLVGKVVGVHPTQVYLSLGGVKGRIHVSEASPQVRPGGPDDDGAAPPPLTERFEKGDLVPVRVLRVQHQRKGATAVELTCRPADLAAPLGELADTLRVVRYADVAQGVPMYGYVQEADENGLWVMVSPEVRGRVPALRASRDVHVLRHLAKHFAPGQRVRCWAVRVLTHRHGLELSLLSEDDHMPGTPVPGTNVIGRVTQIHEGAFLTVQLDERVFGRVAITDMADRWLPDPFARVQEGEFVQCHVLEVRGRHIDLSLRPSHLAAPHAGPSAKKNHDCDVASASDVAVGDLVRGYVKSATTKGVFINLGRNYQGYCQIKDLSDGFIKHVNVVFKPGKLVVGRITAINAKRNQVTMSLRKSAVGAEAFDSVRTATPSASRAPAMVYDDDAYSDEGAASGSASQSEGHSDSDSDHGSGSGSGSLDMEVEGPVRMVVDSDSDDDEESRFARMVEQWRAQSASASASDQDDEDDQGTGSGSGSESESESGSGLPDALQDWRHTATTGKGAASSSASGSASGSESVSASGSESDSVVDEEAFFDAESGSRGPRKKVRQRLMEAETRELEEVFADHKGLPESAKDFERLLVSSPNSSFVWIQYMAFYVSQTELEKARAVAERALNTILFKEEQEKLNVWTAFLNLEHQHGTEDSLMKVFKRACQVNDPLAVHEQLVRIYEDAGHVEEADNMHNQICRQFGKDKASCWTRYGVFSLKHGKHKQTREVLRRALQSLPKSKHVQVMAKFAQAEFKHGEVERGRTLFNELLANSPKRSDLWSMFIDIETAALKKLVDQGARGRKLRKALAAVRNLYDRVVSVNLSKKKVKGFFQRYLRFEAEYGDQSTLEKVKRMAQDYITRRLQMQQQQQ